MAQANSYGVRPVDEGNEMARNAVRKALAIDPQYGPAYAALAKIELNYDWDFTAACAHVEQALAINPGDAFALLIAAELNETLGRLDEAIDLHQQVIVVDPVSYWGHAFLGISYYNAHRLDEAAESLRLAMSMNPSGYGVRGALGLVLLAQGDESAALAAIEQEPWDFSRRLGIAIVKHASGDVGGSDAALQEFIEKHVPGAEYQVAQLYAFRGEIDHAFDWLDQAHDNRDPGLTGMLTSPLLANLHDDPRWEPFLDKMGLPH